MAMFTEKGQGGLESEAGLSIIGTGMRVVGDITADGVVKIEGTVIGGEVRGSIRADERIEIQSTSVVHGDVVAKRLLVQEGGEINGVVRMGEAALDGEVAEPAAAQRSY
jgi:cytoskeletal protein CcmA (bactofilin family)